MSKVLEKAVLRGSLNTTPRFKSKVQVEMFSDYPKRENDKQVRNRVIIPFVQQQKLKEFNMITMPAAAPVWEVDLRAEEALKTTPMHATLVEYDKPTHANLQEVIGGRFLNYTVDNIREQRGGEADEYLFSHDLFPACSIQAAVDSYQLLSERQPVHMAYADFCGCWGEHQLELFDKINQAEYLADEFLFGLTIDLTKRRQDNDYCKRARWEINKVNKSGYADGVQPVFSASVKDRQCNLIEFGARRASHMVKARLPKLQTTLVYAGIYRRGSDHNVKEIMTTLWYKCKR